MFTAIMGTRSIINLIYGGRKAKKLSIGGIQGMKVINFMGLRKVAAAFSITLVLAPLCRSSCNN